MSPWRYSRTQTTPSSPVARSLRLEIIYIDTIFVNDLECEQLLDMVVKGNSRTNCNKKNKNNDGSVIIQKGGGNKANDMGPIIISSDHVACNGSIVHIIYQLLPKFIDDITTTNNMNQMMCRSFIDDYVLRNGK